MSGKGGLSKCYPERQSQKPSLARSWVVRFHLARKSSFSQERKRPNLPVSVVAPRLTVELINDYVLGFIICEIFTVMTLQDWVGWGIFAVIPGNPRRAHSDSQHLEACPELQDWLRSELFTVKNYRTRPFAK